MKPVSFSKDALRTLQRMPKPTAKRIREMVQAYAEDPSSQANNVKSLKGQDAIRLRIGDWRVIMRDDVVIAVLRIAPRGSAYR
jgi:mRNA interferase RelE/StbE